jgi:hypothetical protein
MPKQKFFKFPKEELDTKISSETVRTLKDAWDSLPADFSFNERFLFIEVAERLIKLGEVNDSSN